MDWPLDPPEAERQAGDCQSQKTRGNLGPRDGILHQTVSRLLVAKQFFVGSRTVDICQEGHSQRSAPQRRHVAHLRWHSRCVPRKPSSSDGGGVQSTSTWSLELLGHGKGTKQGHPSL